MFNELRKATVAMVTIAAVFAGSLLSAGDFSVSGEGRLRWEATANRMDFNKTARDSGMGTLTRFRMGMNFTPHANVRAFVQPTYAALLGGGTQASVVNTGNGANGVQGNLVEPGGVTLHQAYVNWNMTDFLSFQAGRQEVQYGNGMLLGVDDWTQVSRALDGGIFHYSREGFGWLDLFMFKVQENGLITNHPADHNLIGLYSSWELGPFVNSLDVYAMMDSSQANTIAGINGTTTSIGVKAAAIIGSFDYSVEGMLQMLNDTQAAAAGFATATAQTEHALDLNVGFTFHPQTKTRVHAGYFRASDLFQDRYSNTHAYLGMADLFAMPNMSDIHFGIGSTPVAKLTLGADFHLFTLTQNTTGVGAQRARGAGGYGAALASKSAGMEFDLTTKYAINDAADLTLGAALISAGDYIKNNNGGVADSAYWAYLQLAARL